VGLETAQPYAFGRQMGRTHDPLAMQKVVGSSPIIRFAHAPLRRGSLLSELISSDS